MNGTIGEIRGFGGNFAPRSWAFCEGQLMAISSNTALFSILGTTYGGDGRTTFALPDLRGRVPVSPGTGPGLSTRILGQRFGSYSNTLTVNNIPTHSHAPTLGVTHAAVGIPALADEAESGVPTSRYLASGKDNVGAEVKNFSTNPSDTTMKTFNAPVSGDITVGLSGGSQQQQNMMPTLTTNYIICLMGIFPSRS